MLAERMRVQDSKMAIALISRSMSLQERVVFQESS